MNNNNENNNYKPVMRIALKHARLMKKNFTGKYIPPYNPEGSRNFLAVIPDDMADELIEQGWKIKHTRPNKNDPDDPGCYYLSVQVGYAYKPPRIQRVCGDNVRELDERSISVLDSDRFLDCTMIIRSRYWGENFDKVKAYLQDMKVVVEPNEFEEFMGYEEV